MRLACAARWLPEQKWPEVDDEALLAKLEDWLLPEMRGVHSLRALKNIDLNRALGNLLDWPMRQRLDSALPTHYTVPTGSQIAIRYDSENPPVLAVRIQEMFGEAQTPCIADGRVPLVLELLSPAQRPLQITPRFNGVLERSLARSAERDEGTLSEARLAGRSGEYCPDAPDEKVFLIPSPNG
ncbi:ATP-dependent RNA helicase HrpB [Cedecea neteri]|uniref:ATP-dependent RNA helicase HrpB n=1 Tax=Cedecea neteri TaxID=158822 RepID=A0A2X2T4P2_9ENTR|nr:ATP-dependent RNA helicase HrpB [Cedecea neteri]